MRQSDRQQPARPPLRLYASDKMPGPLTIVVKGMIAIPPVEDGGNSDRRRSASRRTRPSSAPTARSGFYGGGLWLSKVSNVIVQNLVIAMPNGDDASDKVDAIHVEKSQPDLDRSLRSCRATAPPTLGPSYDDSDRHLRRSDFVTVSWTRYHDHADDRHHRALRQHQLRRARGRQGACDVRPRLVREREHRTARAVWDRSHLQHLLPEREPLRCRRDRRRERPDRKQLLRSAVTPPCRPTPISRSVRPRC